MNDLRQNSMNCALCVKAKIYEILLEKSNDLKFRPVVWGCA